MNEVITISKKYGIFYPPLINPKEEFTSIDESRTSTQQRAIDSINFEQFKQKMQYIRVWSIV